MQPLEVSVWYVHMVQTFFKSGMVFFFMQVELHTAMLTLVLVLVPSTWMMLLVLQVLASFWSALAGQS